MGFNYAKEPQIALTVTTRDNHGASHQQAFTLKVQDDPGYPAPPAPPTNQAGSVSISGEAKVGSTLTASVSDGNGVPANIQYQWYANGQPISGATGKTHILSAAEAGKAITVKASFTDLANYAESPTSPATASVTTPPPVNHAPTAISLSATTLAEGKAGATVGQLRTTDPDAGDTHLYTVSDNRFEVVNGYLKLKAGQLVDYVKPRAINRRVF